MDGVFRRWWIDSDHLRLRPTAGGSTPAAGVTLTGLLLDVGTAPGPDRRADDGVTYLPVEILQRVGLGVDGGSGGTGPKGAILRLLDQEKDSAWRSPMDPV